MTLVDKEIKPVPFLFIRSSQVTWEKKPDGTDVILGKGGFGYVKKAVYKGQEVAVKTLVAFDKDDPSADPLNLLSLLLEEAKSIKKFQHPRIVGLVGIIVETGSLVMEYMSRGSLYQHIQTIRKRMLTEHLTSTELFPWPERTMIALDIAQGMAFLHSKYTKDGKAHANQDLKSAQVLLCMQSGRLRAKISDFYMTVVPQLNQSRANSHKISSAQKQLKSALSISEETIQVYWAPEGVNHDKWTYTSDIYAYGIILLELCLLLSPKQSFQDYSTQLDALNPIPVIANIARQCLSVDPIKRPEFQLVIRQMSGASSEVASELSTLDYPTSSKDLLVQSKEKKKKMASFEWDDASTTYAPSVSKYSNLIKGASVSPSKMYSIPRGRRIIIIVLVIIAIALIIVLVVVRLQDNKPVQASPSPSSSLPLSSLPTPSVQPSFPKYWAGANTYFLYALSEQDQDAIISALVEANVKIVRFHVSRIGYRERKTSSSLIPDVEPLTLGEFDDTILDAIDKSLYKLHQAGLKAIIAFHDRHAMGCYQQRDAYYTALELPPQKTVCNDASVFYQDEKAIAAYEKRIQHILDYSSPSFNDTKWSQLSQVIYAFDIQNRAQLGSSSKVTSWWCDRAKFIKPRLSRDILLSTGGTEQLDDSFITENGDCAELDVIGINRYFNNDQDVETTFHSANQFSQTYNKTVILLQYCPRSYSNDKSQVIRQVASMGHSYLLRWIVWQVVIPGSSWDCDFFTDDVKAWNALSSGAKTMLELN